MANFKTKINKVYVNSVPGTGDTIPLQEYVYNENDGTNPIKTGREAAGVTNYTPSFLTVMEVEVPEFIPLNKGTKLKITTTLKDYNAQANDYCVRLAWTDKLINNVRKIVSNTGPYVGLIDGSGTVKTESYEKDIQGSVSNGQMEFIVDLSILANSLANNVVYLYFYNGGLVTQYNNFYSNNTTAMIETSDTIPSLPSISFITKSQIVKKTSTFTIKWNAINAADIPELNKFKNYKVTYGTSSGTQTVKNFSSATSFALPLSSYSRGDKIIVKIQAISEYDSQRNSTNTYLNTCNSSVTQITITVNSLPTVSVSIASDNEVITGDDTSNRILLSSTFSDSDTSQTLQLKCGTSTSNLITLTKSGSYYYLNLTQVKSLGITSSGNYTLSFYAYDGLEYSSTPAKLTIQVSFSPVIDESSLSSTVTKVKDGLGNTTVIRYISLSFKLKYNLTTNLTYTITINDKNVNSSVVSFQQDTTTKIIKIDTTKLGEVVSPGDSFSAIKMTLKNGNSPDSNLVTFSGTWTRPYLALKITSTSYLNDEKGETRLYPTFFNNSITINYVQASSKANQPAVSKIEAIVNKSGNVSSFTLSGSGKSYSEISSKINRNETASLSLKLTDNTGQTSTITLAQSLTRIGVPTLGEISFVSSEFNPNVSSNFSCMHPRAKVAAPASYECEYTYKGDGQVLSGTVQESSTSSYSFIDNGDFAEYLRNTYNKKNYKGSISFSVTAKDAFGQTVTSSSSFTLNVQTAPSYLESDTFLIYHDYDMNGIARQFTDNKVTSSENQLFNTREGIIFEIPKPSDPNDDFDRFIITRNIDGGSYSSWQTVYLTNPNIVLANNKYYYRYSVPIHENNKTYSYKIKACDSLNKTSIELINNVSLICARVAPSVIEVFNINRTASDEGFSLKFDLKIADLGGSRINSSWSESYYNNYKNLDRKSSIDNKKRYIKVEISNDANFSNVISYDISLDEDQFNYVDINYTFKNYNENKAYLRFTLYIPYGEAGQVTQFINSETYVYMYSGTVPTISYRPNQLGINSSNLNEAVLVIENYGDYDKVVLRGIGVLDNTTVTKEIIIDLKTGAISGATISGGSW